MKSGIKIIQNQIEDLSLRQKIIEAHAISVMAADNQEKIEHDTHKHHFWTGKVKQEKKFLKTTGSSTQDIWYDNAKITQGTLR